MESGIGPICPRCQQPVKSESSVITCPQCSNIYHSQCWDENKGCVASECNTNRCRYCGEAVSELALRCPHCQESLNIVPLERDNRHSKPADFSIREAFGIGFELAMDNLGLFIKATLLGTLIFFLSMILVRAISRLSPTIGMVLQLSEIVLNAFLTVGMYRIGLKVYDGKETSIQDLFSGADITFKLLSAMFLVAILTGLGFMLFIIPGVIIGLMLFLVPFIIVDQEIGIMDSLRQSIALTKGKLLKILGFTFVVSLVNFIGSLPFGLGLLITVPASGLASIHIYRSLQK